MECCRARTRSRHAWDSGWHRGCSQFPCTIISRKVRLKKVVLAVRPAALRTNQRSGKGVNKSIAVAVLPFLFAGCAADLPLAQTESGYPEGKFSNTSLEAVENKLIGACSQIGAMVTESSTNQVVCGKTMEGQSSVLAQLLLGNASSTTPVDNLRFVMYATGSSVHVTAYQWVETQMPFGQVKRADLNGNKQRYDLQQLLYKLGADDPASGVYSNESRALALELLKEKPENPEEGVGETYYVNVPICDVRLRPEQASPVVKQYHQGDALKIYARMLASATTLDAVRVSPDGASPEWVVSTLLKP